MLTIDLDSPVPLIEQLVRGLRRAIAEGRVRPGQELPSVRQLAADLGVNLNTVARAYRILEDNGLVHSARGRGTHITADRETTIEAPDEVERRLKEAVRNVLADAKLAGMTRKYFSSAIRREVDRFWPQAKASQ